MAGELVGHAIALAIARNRFGLGMAARIKRFRIPTASPHPPPGWNLASLGVG